jgi:hypothetical protein
VLERLSEQGDTAEDMRRDPSARHKTRGDQSEINRHNTSRTSY